MNTVEALDLRDVAERALSWAQARDHTGYTKHDGLNSPLLAALTLGNRWLRLVAIQSVMRAPINLRPMLGVRPSKNAKGLSLFARAHLHLYRLTGEERHAAQARALLEELLAHPSGMFRGLSWGYPYPWQDLGFFAPTHFPNRVVTYFVGRALVEGFDVLGDPRYLASAEKAVDFLLNEPKVLFEDEKMLCLSYVPVESIQMVVMDVSALAGALAAMVARRTGATEMLVPARKLLAYVADKQTDYGAWFYTHPPKDSHITHDNYHTGYIVDALDEWERSTGETIFRPAVTEGLRFYRDHLFTADYRPKWMHDTVYPHDVHGYAQGIITFARHGELDFAESVARAAIEDLWIDREDRFAYQRRKHYTKRFTLMRWCQGWMSLALTELLAARGGKT